MITLYNENSLDIFYKIARDYINTVGGFEQFAEWGLF